MRLHPKAAQDTVSKLYDFPAREYGIQGRWPSPDPSGLSSVVIADPQTWNRYAHARNAPLSSVDPTGLFAYTCGSCGGGLAHQMLQAGWAGGAPGWAFSWLGAVRSQSLHVIRINIVRNNKIRGSISANIHISSPSRLLPRGASMGVGQFACGDNRATYHARTSNRLLRRGTGLPVCHWSLIGSWANSGRKRKSE